MQLIIDGTDPEALREIMETEISSMEERHHQGIGFLEGIGGYAPTLGVLGAIMGLITVLSHLSDPNADLGEGIAVAFVASFYGVFTANLFWLPLANKLKIKSKEEVQVRELAMEGLLAIQAGDNPRVVKGQAAGLPAALSAGGAGGAGGGGVSRRKKGGAAEEEGPSERWLITFADLMTLLFALFLVLFATAEPSGGKVRADGGAAAAGVRRGHLERPRGRPRAARSSGRPCDSAAGGTPGVGLSGAQRHARGDGAETGRDGSGAGAAER